MNCLMAWQKGSATGKRPFVALLSRDGVPALSSPPFVASLRRVLSSRSRHVPSSRFAVPRVAVQDFGPKMATEPRSGTDRHGSAPSGARPELATWPFAGSALRRGSRIPPFRARTRFRGHFRAFFAHADTALSGSPDPPSRPPQPRGEPPRMWHHPRPLVTFLLSLSDDIPALSSHPFPTLLPLLATQSRVLRLARNPHGEIFPTSSRRSRRRAKHPLRSSEKGAAPMVVLQLTKAV